jgi:hypothetical protein
MEKNLSALPFYQKPGPTTLALVPLRKPPRNLPVCYLNCIA